MSPRNDEKRPEELEPDAEPATPPAPDPAPDAALPAALDSALDSTLDPALDPALDSALDPAPPTHAMAAPEATNAPESALESLPETPPGAAPAPGPSAQLGDRTGRVVVRRGVDVDRAEWEPRPPGEALAVPRDDPGWIAGPGAWVVGVIAALAAGLLVVWLASARQPKLAKPLVPTLGDLQAVHPGVRVGGEEARGLVRVESGNAVETDADGRARLRLDDGSVVILDRGTRIAVRQASTPEVGVETGRVFVESAPGARSAFRVGGAVAILSGASVGIDRQAGPRGARLYAARGEFTVRAGGAEQTVGTGFSAVVDGDTVRVEPERGYDDWTGGMAAPWGARGKPRRAVGELWGRPLSDLSSPGSPLAVRSHEVRATLARELAETEVSTTYFNAGSEAVAGDFRVALPPGAIVKRFATKRGERLSEGEIALAARENREPGGHELLEWAGEGWLRASIPSISPGQTVTVIVGYAEWLTPRPRDGGGLVVQYRYPMTGDAAAPLIGEFFARVDATPSSPSAMSAGQGAVVVGQAVELRRPDYRPTADLVVEAEIPPFGAPARAYVAPGAPKDGAGDVLLVRTEVPEATREEGVTLALVLDASQSMDPALFEAGRALARAVTIGLGARDRLVVLAADQETRPVGPAEVGPVDDARRGAILAGLDALHPGGATDLGRALEAGADALPKDSPGALVVYIGDGWPTLGDGSADDVLARLARRPGGAPRLGAVGVGPLVNRFGLAALVEGSGPLLEVGGSEDAARVAVDLIAEALRPAIAGVEIDLGPGVERVYPRGSRAVLAGGTAMAVGRFLGEAPTHVTLRYRSPKGLVTETRKLVRERARDPEDLKRRWAAARVQEIALRGRGREAATDVALQAGLLTPWTAFVSGSYGAEYAPTPMATRVLDLSPGPEVTFSAELATPEGHFGTLTLAPEGEGEGEGEDDSAFEASVAAAARRAVLEARPAALACRGSRAALRPELAGSLAVSLEVDGEGRASGVSVKGAGGSGDPAVERCVGAVVAGLRFAGTGGAGRVKVTVTIDLPPPRATLRARACSPTSRLPMPLRRGLWQERLNREAPSARGAVFRAAKETCELPTWTDKRALVELYLRTLAGASERLDLAASLERDGDADAAALVRKETIRRARTPEELASVRTRLLGEERYPRGKFRKEYEAARDDAARLAVVRRFARLAPHDPLLRRRALALFETLGMKVELTEEARRIRQDPFADAALLADVASTLARVGDEAEARRAFGELAERAPRDPWARAFLGDRLLAEGRWDEASRAYQVLEDLAPGDPAAAIRAALAHEGGGRVDVARRLLARVASTGGRRGSRDLAELASALSGVLLAEASAKPSTAPAERDLLVRASLELPQRGAETLLLVRVPPASPRLDARLERGSAGARETRKPELASPALGLYLFRLGPGEAADLRLARPAELEPARPLPVRVSALARGEAASLPRHAATSASLPVSGKPVVLTWDGEAWRPAP